MRNPLKKKNSRNSRWSRSRSELRFKQMRKPSKTWLFRPEVLRRSKPNATQCVERRRHWHDLLSTRAGREWSLGSRWQTWPTGCRSSERCRNSSYPSDVHWFSFDFYCFSLIFLMFPSFSPSQPIFSFQQPFRMAASCRNVGCPVRCPKRPMDWSWDLGASHLTPFFWSTPSHTARRTGLAWQAFGWFFATFSGSESTILGHFGPILGPTPAETDGN